MASVTPLAAFDHEWVGGDIRGLQGVAQALYAYVPRVQDLSGRLSVVAGDLTSPAAAAGRDRRRRRSPPPGSSRH